jgi:hypothetical protein
MMGPLKDERMLIQGTLKAHEINTNCLMTSETRDGKFTAVE